MNLGEEHIIQIADTGLEMVLNLRESVAPEPEPDPGAEPDAGDGTKLVEYPEGVTQATPPAELVKVWEDGTNVVKYEHLNGACFEILPEHSGTTFQGNDSELELLCWGGVDPMDYENIPYTYHGGRTVPWRGSMFALKSNDGPVENVVFDGLNIDGGCIATGNNAIYKVDGWDLGHKGIVFTFKGHPVSATVRNCVFTGWFGEVLYGGGSNRKDILIENVDIDGSNASAISISGNVICRNVHLSRVYNGFENYAHAVSGQFTELYDCSVDMREFGKYGVVYIGEDGNTHLTIDGLVVQGAQGGIYMDGSAYNVDIRNADFLDCREGIRLWNINAGTYNLTPEWRDFRFENVNVIASNSKVAFGIAQHQDYQPLGTWILDNVNMVTQNGQRIGAAFRLESRDPNNRVIIRNCDFSQAQRGVIGGGTPPIYEGDNNKIPADRINAWTLGGKMLHLHPMVPKAEVVNLPEAGLAGVEFVDPQLYPDGWEFELSNLDRSGVSMTVAGVTLEPGDAATLVAVDGQFSVSNFEQGKYA